jgi:hypothetical protein
VKAGVDGAVGRVLGPDVQVQAPGEQALRLDRGSPALRPVVADLLTRGPAEERYAPVSERDEVVHGRGGAAAVVDVYPRMVGLGIATAERDERRSQVLQFLRAEVPVVDAVDHEAVHPAGTEQPPADLDLLLRVVRGEHQQVVVGLATRLRERVQEPVGDAGQGVLAPRS